MLRGRFIRGTCAFLSTPTARRATVLPQQTARDKEISIHALREEGDPLKWQRVEAYGISIHALREEGDIVYESCHCDTRRISIHALREEGDD